MVVIKNKNIQYNIKHSVDISMNQAAESAKRSAKRILRWTFQMIEVLILSLNNCKSSIDCKGKTLKSLLFFLHFWGDRKFSGKFNSWWIDKPQVLLLALLTDECQLYWMSSKLNVCLLNNTNKLSFFQLRLIIDNLNKYLLEKCKISIDQLVPKHLPLTIKHFFHFFHSRCQLFHLLSFTKAY